jgi:hypothetical protein
VEARLTPPAQHDPADQVGRGTALAAVPHPVAASELLKALEGRLEGQVRRAQRQEIDEDLVVAVAASTNAASAVRLSARSCGRALSGIRRAWRSRDLSSVSATLAGILGRRRNDFDPVQLDRSTFYKLLWATVVPRPIAWVATTSAAGTDNLAPAAFAEKRCR